MAIGAKKLIFMCVNQSRNEIVDVERDVSLDILKGIAILLVIVGHSKIGNFWHNIIYSFHMPLFFFLSGYFIKGCPIWREVRAGINRLMLPYIFVAFVICLILFAFVFFVE